MATAPTVDVSTFNEEQKRALQGAASLGTGINTINTSQLAPSGSLNLPSFPQTNPQELMGTIKSIPEIMTNQVLPEQQLQDTFRGEILRSLDTLGGRGEATIKAEEAAGIPTQQKQLMELSSGIRSLQAEALAIPLQIQEEFTGRGATMGGAEPIQTSRLRQNAIKSLSLSAQAQAVQGNIALAQQQVDRAIELEFAPEERRLNWLKQAYEFNREDLDRASKERADKQRVELEERTRLLDAAKQDRQSRDTLGIKLAELGLDSSSVFSSASYSDALKTALPQLAQRAKDDIKYQGLLRDAELELRRININNARLNGDKISADIIAEKNKSKIASTDKEAETEKALALFSQVSKVANMPGKSAAVGFGLKKNVFTRTAAGAATGAGIGAAAGAPFAGVGAIPGALAGTVLGGVSGFFAGPEALQGSDRADFEAQAKRLANLLTVDNLDLMKGVLSETDIKILESAGSTLGNFDISEKQYDEELQRIKQVSERNYKKLGITDEQAQFWFGITDDDIEEIDILMGNSTPTNTVFNANSYYK